MYILVAPSHIMKLTKEMVLLIKSKIGLYLFQWSCNYNMETKINMEAGFCMENLIVTLMHFDTFQCHNVPLWVKN